MAHRRLLNLIGLAIGSRAHRKEILRRIRSSPVALIITFRALLKWRADKQSLPLTRHHFGLYLRIHRYMWRTLGRFPDLVQPQGFNDHIQWLKLFDQSAAHHIGCDKIAVRDLVSEVVGDHLLVRLHRVCNHASELRSLGGLPSDFVLKASHDSGSVTIIRNGALDRESLVRHYGTRLRARFGHASGEWPYTLVRPRILIEEFLSSPAAGGIPDYKFHCVDGRVAWVQYESGRFGRPLETVLNAAGNPIDVHFNEKYGRGVACEFIRPSSWYEMVQVAEALSAGWKYVRIDLYDSVDGIRFGEMTFFPLAGCYAGEGQLELGPLMTFDRTTFRPPLTRRQRRNILKRGVVPAGNRVPA